MPKPIHANPVDFAMDMYHKIFGLPGRIQGMALNALINTIDRAQTEQALKEAELADRMRAQQQQSENKE